MKIRSGFVSNSSSSSFIISDDHFPTVRDLAIYMINKMSEDYGDYDQIEPNEEGTTNVYDIYIERLKNIDENQTVSFPSCNYDTYIRKVGDQYFVSTCNNTDWDLYEYSDSKLTESTKTELRNLMNFYEENEKNSHDCAIIENLLEGDYYDFSAFGIDFYDLENEILGVETFTSCPNSKNVNHEYRQSYLWDTVRHGKTCLVCNPVFKRKEKLENINKISEE